MKPDGYRVEYEYNPLGQLARKLVPRGASFRLTQDKNNLRESASSVDTSASTSHIAPSTSHSAVVVSDFLGTTLGTVSGESFRPVHLTAFGEQIAADSTSSILDSDSSAALFYTGKHYDSDLQAYHFLYRNYSPTQGRWTAADPSGFPDGPNQWLYVNNSVTGAVDPLGLSTTTVIGHSTHTMPGAVINTSVEAKLEFHTTESSDVFDVLTVQYMGAVITGTTTIFPNTITVTITAGTPTIATKTGEHGSIWNRQQIMVNVTAILTVEIYNPLTQGSYSHSTSWYSGATLRSTGWYELNFMKILLYQILPVLFISSLSLIIISFILKNKIKYLFRKIGISILIVFLISIFICFIFL